jgi:hypothetical protein
MAAISVLTSITGGKDRLRDDQIVGEGRFIAYVSEPCQSTVWEERPAYDRFRSDRRNSRAPKILTHLFCDTECSIWIDGNIALRTDPASLAEKWLADHDFAVIRHPDRQCLYAEAAVCLELGLDDPDVINEQIRKYAANGYPHDQGLPECNVIIRRHTPKVIEFNNTWWSEYCAHSVRDQLSFMYAANKTGLGISWISPAVRTGNTDFDGAPHLTPRPEPR